MCRHLAYIGPAVPLARLLTEPPHSLYEQSWRPARQRYGTVNADGFGVGWYPPEPGDAGVLPEPGQPGEFRDAGQSGEPGEFRDAGEFRESGQSGEFRDAGMPVDAGESAEGAGHPLPARYRRAVPVWADANFTELARAIRSGAVLAAVRSATEGTTQDESAAAPFRDGRWLFSHNGAVADWTRLPVDLPPAALLAMEARSDSALLWAMLAGRLRRGEAPAGAMAAVIREVAAARPAARLNFLLTDGRTITASAYGDTLWYRTGPGRVLVASEPDDAPGRWHEVPDRSLLVASASGVRILPLRPPRGTQRKEFRSMTAHRFTLDDRLPADYLADALRTDVREGLRATPRTLPPKWFYDKRGSDLFEQITKLPEYYPTRAEQEILVRRAPETAALTRAATLAELGSGSSRKTRLLLDALTAGGTLRRYAPLDVSGAALSEAGESICRDYPELEVAATVGDFEHDGVAAALADGPGPRLLAFLGSTIGNFDRGQRQAFYRTLSLALSSDDALLLGADLVKDPETLVRAYDDAAGVTAEFDKNVLHVLNRELGADFDPAGFDHVAVWDAEEERIEMRLRARRAQTVKIPGIDLSVDFADGEDLRTEISCKFRRESLTAELEEGGFTVRNWWTDSAGRFALLLAVPS